MIDGMDFARSKVRAFSSRWEAAALDHIPGHLLWRRLGLEEIKPELNGMGSARL